MVPFQHPEDAANPVAPHPPDDGSAWRGPGPLRWRFFFSVGEMAKTFRGGKPWENHGKTICIQNR